MLVCTDTGITDQPGDIEIGVYRTGHIHFNGEAISAPGTATEGDVVDGYVTIKNGIVRRSRFDGGSHVEGITRAVVLDAYLHPASEQAAVKFETRWRIAPAVFYCP